MSTTPQMSLVLPVPTTTVGPEWASELVTALTVVDDHDHSSGKGKKVTPAGININTDLDILANAVVNTNSVKFVNQTAAITGVSKSCTVQFANGNFYIVNSGGTAVQITSGNNIVSTVVIPASPLMPSGTILDFAGSTAPIGFLLCSGQDVSRTTYSDLFNSIGTAWGAGNGTTTFTLPNLNGKTTIGAGSYVDAGITYTRSVGPTVLGETVHMLTTAEMPSHTHIQDAHSHTVPGFGDVIGAAVNTFAAYYPTARANSTNSTTATNQNTGGSAAHNNMQPSIVVLKMIKT